ncbi:hypothetical protein [Microbacterium invictum]|uniref:Lipoprotein n=1 Tax=Microbacterium invictum TaxID=515415 RepID=A0ABZ0VBS2_9MICO|nr:hypothetical protein [Microbacterium invictum]WQB69585.1 hypothetical protein T9R20_12885 [Microbacterium invictum]
MRSKAAIGTLSLLAVLGLAGCTGLPTAAPAEDTAASQGSSDEGSSDASGDGGQTTEDACLLISDSITEATTEFQEASADDPGAVAEAARAAADSLASAASQVTNDEIAALLPELQDMFTQTAEVMDAVAGGDVSQIGDAAEIGESFQVTVTKFQELCAP